MKVFLFAYPIRHYVEQPLHELADHGLSAARFDELIDLRYRQRGYQVAWLVFNQQGRWKTRPDLKLWSEIFHRHPEDLLLLSGVGFFDLVAYLTYPRPAHVIRQLPKRPERLVLGGFHQYDCVERLARFAHRKGINTWVDEDLTQFFFHQILRPGGIPTIRDAIDWEYFHVDPENEWDVRSFRQTRRDRPWLTQL